MLLKVMERYFYKNLKLLEIMKKEVIGFLSLILLIPLISAQFSVSDFFSNIDAQSVFIVVCFGVLGLLLSTILNRFAAFRGTTAGIMSLLLSLGMTWGINKWINLNGLLSGIGFSGDILPYLLVALLIVLIFFLWKFKWIAFWISGLIMVLIALFTDWIYETGIVLIAGIIFLIIGTLWWWRKKRGGKIRFSLLMIILGLLIGTYGLYIKDTLYMIIGGILFLLGIIFWIIGRKKEVPQTPQQAQQQQVLYQQRKRTLYDLKQKYMAYLFYYNRRGLTKHERKRILKAMNIIIDYARKVGVSQGEFLSSKTGGSNAKAPGDLKPPFDG